jgi:peptide-methionine (S)-S-oxide reductase
MERALLAGGCFWCLEPLFQRLRGVRRATSGYCGGDAAQADYRSVCSGQSGHAETVEVEFDPQILPYQRLLEVFFAIHDPTTPNRQGNDSGTQYRSAIFTCSQAQADCAHAYVQQLEADQVFAAPIVTEILPAPTFYPAEELHQNYFSNNRQAPYCQAVIAPKEAKFLQYFRSALD